MWRRLCVLSLCLLFLLALCLVPPVIADTPAPSTKKKSPSTSTAPSSSSTPSSTTSSPPPPHDDREARATRKSTRLDASKRRIDQQTRRVKDKASKLVKKYTESRKKRLNSVMLRQQKEVKAAQRSELYWQNKKDSIAPAVLKKGEKKLTSLASLSSDAPIRVKSSQFSELIATSPRPYWVFLSLTALSLSYECKVCTAAHTAFVELAPIIHSHTLSLLNSTGGVHGYNVLLDFNLSTSTAERERLQREFDDEAKKGLPIFVVEADIDENRNAFNALQLTSAPTLVLLPPSFSAKPLALASLLAGVASKYRYIPQSLDLSATTFIDFINHHIDPKLAKSTTTGVGFIEAITARLHSFNPVILGYFSVIATGLLLYLLIAAYRTYCVRGAVPFSVFQYFLPSSTLTSYTVTASSIASLNFYQLSTIIPKLPLILSAVTFYFFCVSGGMFTIIKESEAGYEYTSSGVHYKGDWISRQYMDQTVAESTVLTGLYLTLFALIVLLNSRTFYVRREGGGGWLGGWRGVGGYVMSWVLSPVGVLLLIGLVYLQLVNVYGKKNSYHWGMNWKWLNAVQWTKVIPYPPFHRYADQLWKIILKRMW